MTRALHIFSATDFAPTTRGAKSPAHTSMFGRRQTGVRQGTAANTHALAMGCALD